MRIVIFYEKPGCATNARQKRVLRESGCMVIERNLLEHGMERETLAAFFDKKPVSEWFNPNAPKVKSGEINPSAISKSVALELLMMEPILIRRPLMVIGSKKFCGFPEHEIETMIGRALGARVNEGCSSSDEACKPLS